MRTSVAVMALVYGASAAAVHSATTQQSTTTESAITTQSATTAVSASDPGLIPGCQPWCKMNVPQKAWCLKSHVAKYVKDKIRFYYNYKKAWWTQHWRAVRNAPRHKRLYLLNKYRLQWIDAKKNWKKGDKRRRNEMYAMVKQLTKTNCSTLKSAIRVTRSCDGAVQRMKREQFATLFEIYKGIGGRYTDVSFPADTSSVFWEEAKPRTYDITSYFRKPYNNWERVRDLNKAANGDIWGSKGILPDGVVQGYVLGDCWWVAVASALAEYPHRIKKIFNNMDVEKGLYEFEFFSQGKANKVVIDDKLPTNGKGQPEFARASTSGAWWLPLLEKATAKFFGTYENMNTGVGDIAFQQLTGYPTKWFMHSDGYDKLFAQVVHADTNKYIMTTATSRGNEDTNHGITPGHEYTLIRRAVMDGIQFVQIRNPQVPHWEFTGAWSDHDTKTDATQLAKFRAAVKRLMSHDKVTNDGKFWMTFSDYHKYFEYTMVGYYLDGYDHTSYETSISSLRLSGKYYTMHNPVKQHVYLAADPIQMYQFMDPTCEDEKKPRSAKVNRRVDFTMHGQTWYIDHMSDKGYGQPTFVYFADLPAGKYPIWATKDFTGASTGDFPFGFTAHASSRSVKITDEWYQ